MKNGARRVVQFLAYPGNYGMVPSTLHSKESGGDDDPLDVIVLGASMARGALVPVTPIGVLGMLDGASSIRRSSRSPATRPSRP